MEARLRSWLTQVLGSEAAAAAALDSRPAHAVQLVDQFERGGVPALFCYIDNIKQLHVAHSIPKRFGKLLYLLREPGNSACDRIAAGQLNGHEPLRQLQQVLVGLHLPRLQALGSSWPGQLQHGWATHTNTFCSVLSEAIHAPHGLTMLHVPPESGLGDPNVAARQQELVQRLEVQLLRWTHQIRNLLAQQQAREQRAADMEGPMEEVAFWRRRTIDLSRLQAQLEGAGMAGVLRVLEAARSPHVPAFLKMRGSIAAEAEQAASNLSFLEALEIPISQLNGKAPAHLADALPVMLDACRMVWTLAPHYNTPDQMTGLLHKVGSAVVAQCRGVLDVNSIFDGLEISEAEQRLQQCCDAVVAARAAYEVAAQRVADALPQRPWTSNPASIYAHVEAFLQRCQDLQEVCAAQRQFSCSQHLTAMLSGNKASEIARTLEEVHQAFARQMRRLQGLDYDVLDVRLGHWYEDMSAFRTILRDLEQMLGNILATAVGHASCLTTKLDVIEAFAHITTRDGLRKALDLSMSDWHLQFLHEVAVVKQLFHAIQSEMPSGMRLPHHAGRVVLLSGLLQRIEHTWDHLAAMAGYLPKVPMAAQSAAAYEALHMGLQQSINNLNMQWYGSMPPDIASHLQDNLFYQDKATGGLLHVNISWPLHRALEEGYLFERQRLGVPLATADLLSERHLLLAAWNGSVQVSRCYNAVLSSLSAEERRLCKDRIRFLDRRVLPGINKLTWGSPHRQTVFFHKDALRCCKQVAVTVAELKTASAAVAATCTLFREALLVRMERKRLYDLPGYEQHQAAHQVAVCAKMQDAYSHLCASLISLYRRFEADSEDVQREWLAFLQRSDAQLLEALTCCVRRSLHEVAQVLQGDQKAMEMPPVFVLSIILDTNGRVELQPTLQHLFDTVHNTSKSTIAALDALPRLLPEVLTGCSASGPLPGCLREAKVPPSFMEVVGKNEEAVTKQMHAITRGISSIVERVQQVLTFHERKYMVSLWQTDCAAYMKRYERANKPVTSFLADIQKYQDLKEEVLSEDSTLKVRWLHLNASTFKHQLVMLCDSWVAAFSGLLASMASRQLNALHEELEQHIAELTGHAAARPANESKQQLSKQEEMQGMQEEKGGQEAVQEAGQGAMQKAAAGGGGVQEAEDPVPAEHVQVEVATEVRCAVNEEMHRQAFERLEALHGRLEGERQELHQRIADCQDKYDALINMQTGVSDEELEQIDRLPVLWEEFVLAIDRVPARLRDLWV